jgi:hypothetical protein
MLPADYLIDFVRIYQKEGAENLDCSPPEYPTKSWIHKNSKDYFLDQELSALDENLPIMEEPLKYVNAGGSACNGNEDCGHGFCNKKTSTDSSTCECFVDWTGPKCLAAAAGPSRVCQAVTNLTKGSACRAPRGLVVNRVAQFEVLIDGQCSLLRSAVRAGAPAAVAKVCDLVHWNGTYGQCSSEMRADLVLQAWSALTNGQQCCGSLGSMMSM